jgi:WD40 repeat protein
MSADGSYIAAVGGDGVHLFSRADNTPILSYGLKGVWLVSMSADGSYIAVGSIAAGSGSRVYLLSRADNTPIWSYQITALSISMSADGSYIAVGGDSTVHLFSRADNTPIWSYQAPSMFGSVSISSNGSCIAAGSYGGTLEGVYLFAGEPHVAPDETWLLAIVTIVGCVVLGIVIALSWRKWGR